MWCVVEQLPDRWQHVTNTDSDCVPVCWTQLINHSVRFVGRRIKHLRLYILTQECFGPDISESSHCNVKFLPSFIVNLYRPTWYVDTSGLAFHFFVLRPKPSDGLLCCLRFYTIIKKKIHSFLNGGQVHHEIRNIFRKTRHERADILIIANLNLWSYSTEVWHFKNN